MALEGERYPAPDTEEARRRRRLKAALIWLGVFIVLIIVVLQLISILDPPRIYSWG